VKHLASPRFWRHYRDLPEVVRRLADKNFEFLILITPRCISRRLIGSGLLELALTIKRWAWTQLIQSWGFGLDPMRIMTSSSNAAAEQSHVADGAMNGPQIILFLQLGC
jgi:hypothetical protein